jgi:DNA-binding GntR family transcriptional regulator
MIYDQVMRRTTWQGAPAKQMLSEQVYDTVRADMMRGVFGPGDPLKPQDLAVSMGVSLAVVREALLRLVGDGLADRLPNRGFAVPAYSDLRWQQLAEARLVAEPAMLRMSIERGDLDWEGRVRAAHHRLARTPVRAEGKDLYFSDEWGAAHYNFHRTLLDGCGNAVLLETFDRLWTATDLARRWSGYLTPGRDHVTEHRQLEEAALARDAEAAIQALTRHLTLTSAAMSSDGDLADQELQRPRTRGLGA